MSTGKKLEIIKDILGSHYKSKNELLFTCPKCNHHKRKLSVNVEKDVFKCWVCDYSGRSLQRLVRRYGDYNQRIEWKALTSNVDVLSFSDELFSAKEDEKPQEVALPEEYVCLANRNLPLDSVYARRYLKDRGITKADILKWKIGYCSTGKFAGRVIIPSFGLAGKCNYFIARTYQKEWRKYLNPEASRDIIFNHLYLDFDEDIILVEGTFDALNAGVGAVPLLGSTLRENPKLFQEIVKNDSTVYIALDQDAEKKARRLIRSLLEYDIEVYKVNLDGYADVGEMPKDEFNKRKLNAVLMNSEYYLLSGILKI